jgi:hypothetical protein
VIERDNESIPWERLREAQRAHEIRMDREVQLSLLTGDQIAGTLEEAGREDVGSETLTVLVPSASLPA